MTAKELIEAQIARAASALAHLHQDFAGKNLQNLMVFTEAVLSLLTDVRADLANYADRELTPDEVPIRSREFLRRHPELTHGYSVAQPYLGAHVMSQVPPGQPQGQPQGQQPQQQTAGINPQQIQQLLQGIGQYAPVVFAFLQSVIGHLGGGGGGGGTPGPAPQFGGAGPTGETLEHLARASAAAIKQHAGNP